jgi:CelD/BcsL family acetyltransferase involved in cellulose biosynthesis
MNPTLELIQSVEGFHNLQDEWQELLKASDTDRPFLTWEWLYTWWKYLSGNRRLLILVVRRGKEPIALAPFCLRPPDLLRLLPVRSIEFLGTGAVGSDYLDVIVRRGERKAALGFLAEYLTGRHAPVALSQLGPGSPGAELACRIAEEGWEVAAEISHVCPYIDLAGHTWNSYLRTLSPSHRYNFGRRYRNLSAHTPHLRFEGVSDETQRRDALRHLYDLHTQRWSLRGGSDALCSANLLRFHEEFTRIALARGWLRLFVLSDNGAPAAALYGLRYNGTFYFYQSGFDPSRGKQSVGLITLGLAIKSALEEGATEFDLLHGEERYKFHWARQARKLQKIELYPPHGIGHLCGSGMRLSRTSRRVARRLLPSTVADWIAAACRRERWRGSYVAGVD